MTDSLTTLASNAILVRRDFAISTITGQVPKDTLMTLRTSPFARGPDVLYSTEDLDSLKKGKNECYMCQVLKQAVQLKQGQPYDLKIPRSKPQSSLQGSSSTASQAKSKTRATKTSSSRQLQSQQQSLCPQSPQQQTSKPQGSRTDLREEVPITPRGSEYPWFPNLGHFLQGPSSPNIPACQVGGRHHWF